MEKKLFDSLINAIEYIDDGIFIIDVSGKIIYCNKAAKLLDEIDIDKAIGRHLLDVYPSLTYETSTLLKVLKTNKPIYNVEQNFFNYKGDKISTINTTLPIIYNNKTIGAVEISKNITRVKELSEKIVNLQRELYENAEVPLTQKPTAEYTFLDIIGQNKEMLKLKTLGTKAARSDSPVMVSGRTGTGKELLVQAIHNSSDRKYKPFIAQNCAALPSNLLESLLFGSVKGSFTGAENKPGLFELANGGTLFLDEVNSMPLELQAKLLRVLQDGKIRRVGSSSTIKVDVRIISAINTPIEKVLELKQMRLDLFYRLNVISLTIPDLQNRRDDIPLLVDYFIKYYNKKCNKQFTGMSKNVTNIFFDYKWPGNVRELQHTIESIINLYDDELIREEYLPFQFKKVASTFSYDVDASDTLPLEEAMFNVEKDIITSALRKNDNNISKTAKLLNIPRQTLQYKIRKLGIS